MRSLTESFTVDLDEDAEIFMDILYEESRHDPFTFMNVVMKDESGKPLSNGEIHLSWWLHIGYCWLKGVTPYILAPYGSGKSTHISVGLPLFEIGRNQNIRIATVCNTDDNAKKRMATCKLYIERDKDFKAVFPNVEPDYGREWSAHRLYVKRTGMSIDPTLESYGVLSTAQGHRLELLIEDDLVDKRDAVSAAHRKQVIEAMENTWVSRLRADDGRRVGIFTAWHVEDWVHRQMAIDTVCTLKQAISKDKTHIVCTVYNAPDEDHPLYRMKKEVSG